MRITLRFAIYSTNVFPLPLKLLLARLPSRPHCMFSNAIIMAPLGRGGRIASPTITPVAGPDSFKLNEGGNALDFIPD